MEALYISELAKIVDGRVIGQPSALVTGVCLDSRKVKPGDLFIPLEGRNTDGHNYIMHAFSNGATAALSEKGLSNIPHNATVILVDDALSALQKLGIASLNKAKPIVVGVTGSTGKTSTKEMIDKVLKEKYSSFKSEGNLNSEQGLPLALCELCDQDEVATLEMGMRGKGQIKQLTEIAKPNIAVITNIGKVHLELFNNQEELAMAKAEILEGLEEDGVGILNGDDKWCREIASRFSDKDIKFFGLEDNNDYQAIDLERDSKGSFSYTLIKGKESIRVYLPLPGKYLVYNSLAAFAVGDVLEVSWDDIVEGISQYQTLQGRQKVHYIDDVTIIDDTYNSNPDSIKAALEQVKYTPSKGKKIAVLGDMKELGGEAELSHRQVGIVVENYDVDIVICYGELAKYIGEELDVRHSSVEVYYEQNKENIVKLLKNIVKKDDVLLVKGSRSMEMEKILTDYTGKRLYS
ncbi:MAG: UDP-N-acetylmuramoyl-tripeptide--D-alanyl-D-alanine ligase [Clostridia bacterium]